MTQLPALFRFSTYLSLALATLCVGIAESDQLGGASGFYLVVGLAILTSYLLEDRWLIPKNVANLLALLILGGWALWAKLSLGGTPSGEDAGTDLLRLLLPRAGPLLAVLMLVKLFRPKAPADYWSLHGLALMQVVLGCVLALSSRLDRENLLFASVLGLYMLCFVWASLTFYVYREHLAAQQAPTAGRRSERTGPAAPRPRTEVRSPWRALGLASSIGWFLLAFVLALVLFFLVPRTGHDTAAALVFRGQAQAVTGFNPGMDLNNVGLLQVNEELVMRVEARDAADQPLNLGPEVRFRGVTCSDYDNGRWRPRRLNDVRQITNTSAPAEQANPITLTYHIDMTKVRAGGMGTGDFLDSQVTPVFLLEPLYTPRGQPPVQVANRRDAQQGFSYRDLEPALLAPNLRRSRAVRYAQVSVLPPATQTKWVQPIWKQRYQSTYLQEHYRYLRELPPRLAQEGRLVREAQRILRAANLPPNAGDEQKARALEAYFVTSGQFEYALEWQRADTKIDPTEDFLLNVKKGHCELFASALALMLRSQEIPARVVIGFRGAEWNTLTEQMEVRQYHAHAWVEALVDRREERLGAPFVDWHWMTLDPTPAGGTAGAIGAENLRGAWDDEIHLLQFLWESFILDYSGEGEREQLLARLGRFQWLRSTWEFWSDLASVNLTLTVFLGGGFLLLVVWAIARRIGSRRVRTQQRISVAFYARLLKLLERVPLRPTRAQTPAEFGQQVATSLAQRLPAPEVAPLAQLPLRIIDFFYAVRFGGRTLDADQTRRIDQDLDRLAKALQT